VSQGSELLFGEEACDGVGAGVRNGEFDFGCLFNRGGALLRESGPGAQPRQGGRRDLRIVRRCMEVGPFYRERPCCGSEICATAQPFGGMYPTGYPLDSCPRSSQHLVGPAPFATRALSGNNLSNRSLLRTKIQPPCLQFLPDLPWHRQVPG